MPTENSDPIIDVADLPSMDISAWSEASGDDNASVLNEVFNDNHLFIDYDELLDNWIKSVKESRDSIDYVIAVYKHDAPLIASLDGFVAADTAENELFRQIASGSSVTISSYINRSTTDADSIPDMVDLCPALKAKWTDYVKELTIPVLAILTAVIITRTLKVSRNLLWREFIMDLPIIKPLRNAITDLYSATNAANAARKAPLVNSSFSDVREGVQRNQSTDVRKKRRRSKRYKTKRGRRIYSSHRLSRKVTTRFIGTKGVLAFKSAIRYGTTVAWIVCFISDLAMIIYALNRISDASGYRIQLHHPDVLNRVQYSLTYSNGALGVDLSPETITALAFLSERNVLTGVAKSSLTSMYRKNAMSWLTEDVPSVRVWVKHSDVKRMQAAVTELIDFDATLRATGDWLAYIDLSLTIFMTSLKQASGVAAYFTTGVIWRVLLNLIEVL